MCLYSRRLENGGDIDRRAESSSTMVAELGLELELIVVVLVSSALARVGFEVVVRSADAMANVCSCRNCLRFGDDLDGAGGDVVDGSSSACASKHVLFANHGDGMQLR